MNKKIIFNFILLSLIFIVFNFKPTNVQAISIIKYNQPTKEAVLPDDLRKKYDTVIKDGKSLLGVPYLMGGKDRNVHMDCSYFVYTTYKTAGIDYGGYKTSGGLYAISNKITDPAPGDLVFFSAGGSSITHVSIYLGNGMLLHESGKKANISPIKGWSWEKIFVGFGRLKQLDGNYKSTDATSDYSKNTSGGASDSSATVGNKEETDSSKKETSSSSSTTESNYKAFDPFHNQSVSKNQNTGANLVNLTIPTEVSYALNVLSQFVAWLLRFLMILLAIVMMVYLALQIMIYTVISKNGSYNELVDKLESKLFSESTTFNSYLKTIGINTVVTAVIVAFAIGSFYVITMQNLYIGLITFLQFIF